MTAATDTRSVAAAAGMPGLVSSRTSLPSVSVVSLHDSDQTLRRLSRLRRNVLGAGRLHALADDGKRAPVAWFVTLTYVHGDQWHAQHIAQAVQRFRRWCDSHRIPCRYVWVAELQARGAMHYHVIAYLPKGYTMPKWDRQRDRTGRVWWPWGMSQRERSRSGAGYLVKYLSKLGEFHRFPKGARLYGIGGLSRDGRSVRSWWNLPEWCRRLHGVGEVVRRAGRLVVLRTGELLAPRFEVRRVPGGLAVRQLQALAERFHDGPYSTLVGVR